MAEPDGGAPAADLAALFGNHLLLWLDASDRDSLGFDDGGWGAPYLSSWRDKSPRGQHAAAVVTFPQPPPHLGPAGLVAFQAANGGETSRAAFQVADDPAWHLGEGDFLLGARFTFCQAEREAPLLTHVSAESGLQLLCRFPDASNATVAVRVQNQPAVLDSPGGVNDQRPHTVVAQRTCFLDGGMCQLALSLDGAEPRTMVVPAGNASGVGAPVWIGAEEPGGGYWGFIHEVVAVSGAVSEPDRRRLQDHLTAGAGQARAPLCANRADVSCTCAPRSPDTLFGGRLNLWLDGDSLPAQAPTLDRWRDSSGHGRDAVAPAGRQPSLVSREDGGREVSFSELPGALDAGHQLIIEGEGALRFGMREFAIAVVVRSTNTGSEGAAGGQDDSMGTVLYTSSEVAPYPGVFMWAGADTVHSRLPPGRAGFIVATDNAFFVRSPCAVNHGARHVLIMRRRAHPGGLSVLEQWLNGRLQSAVAVGWTNTNDSTAPPQLGCQSRTDGCYRLLHGAIGEVVAVEDGVTHAELEELNAYLMHKHGVR